MTVGLPPTRFTPDDVLRLEDEGLFELVDGRLVEKPMSSVASETTGIIITRLSIYVWPLAAGSIYPEHAFQCFPHDSDLIRRPDVAFVAADRRGEVPDEGHIPIPPDLAVEVVSPNDKVYELDEKLADYRSAGIKLVWVVNPVSRMIRVHRADHTVSELSESDTITGESVLPGFSILVKELLPPPRAPQPVSPSPKP